MTLDGLFPHALMTFRDRTEKTALLDLTDAVNDTCLATLAELYALAAGAEPPVRHRVGFG